MLSLCPRCILWGPVGNCKAAGAVSTIPAGGGGQSGEEVWGDGGEAGGGPPPTLHGR